MLSVYKLDQSKEWDSIVKTFEKYDVYHLSGYTKAFKIHGDGEPALLCYTGSKLRGINVVMIRDIADDLHFEGKLEKDTYFDIATPYGYGGWLFEGEEDEASYLEFREDYLSWCAENNFVSEFVRFHPVLENASGVNQLFYEPIFLGNTIAIRLDNEEAIWNRYSSKNRGHIRVAAKEGVTVKVETSDEAFEIFRNIYETTMDHDDATSYYYFKKPFFDSVKNDLDGNYSLFTAYLGDVPIASSIMLYAGKYMNYHLSGQLFEYRRYAGTSMILNEAAKWGCAHGYDWLHLGGGLGAQEGPLYAFKKSFYKKGEDKLFHVGKKILNEGLYDKLTAMREDLPESGFFPRYRA